MTTFQFAGQSPPAAWVVERRAAARMTQAEAAALVYCGRRLWQMYEAGEIRMPADRAELFWLKTRARVAYTARRKAR